MAIEGQTSLRHFTVGLSRQFLGLPYIWGGDDPMQGFDCSGFVIELLKSVGKLPRGGDWTAAMLYEKFQERSVEKPGPGCLVFYHNNSLTRIVHIEFCLDAKLAIGASGGGSRNITVQDAIDKNAYIKIRPIDSRVNIAGYVDPFMTGEELAA